MENMLLAINRTFTGTALIFVALILLILLIYSYVRRLSAKRKGQAISGVDGGEASVPGLDADRAEDINLNMPAADKPDEELAAVIMAAIQASMAPESQCRLRIKSFRRIEQSSPVWNRAGRLEQIANKL